MQHIEIERKLAWIPLFLIIYNFAANLANDIYLPSLPTLARDFVTTPAIIQLTMSAWFAGVALPQLFLGPLTDRVGRLPILFLGGFIFLASTMACGLAYNAHFLIMARFIQGMGVCSLNVTSFSILIDLYAPKIRMKIMNKINMYATLAPLIGPVIGGYILTIFNWRINFLLVFVLGFIGLLGLKLTLCESNLYLNSSATHIRVMARGYYQLIKTDGFLKNLLPYCLILGGLVAYLTASPFIVIDQLHISAENFGYTQVPVFLAYVIGSFCVEYLVSEENIQKILGWGIRIVVLGSAMMLVSSLFGTYLITFIIPMTVYALGLSLCGSALVSEAMDVSGLIKGSAAAFLGFGMAVSCVLSSFALGLVYNGKVFSVALLISIMAGGAYYVYKLLLMPALDSQRT